jgi:hypothetical protein
LTAVAVYVNAHLGDQYGAISQRTVRHYFQEHPAEWAAYRQRMQAPLTMSADLFGQLFDAPVRCDCRLEASEECSVRDCAGCHAAMTALAAYAAEHLVDARGARITANALYNRLWSRPDEWDVLRVGLLPEVEAVEVEDCSICMTPMLRARRLPCGHAFHADCVGPWLRRVRRCPLCRAPQP